MSDVVRAAASELKALIDASPITAGMTVRASGSHLVVSREDPPGPFAAAEPDDRVRFTHLGQSLFGLSVRRHTGRWEKTPFSGPLPDMVQVVRDTMQHLIAPW
jgi:hypothetical protein